VSYLLIAIVVIVALLIILFAWLRRRKYKIAASAGENGKIDPEGTVKVKRGDDQVFTVTPDAHYSIADVKVDGESIGPKPSYAFVNVKKDHTISATFKPE
jgi:hypothetical protein